MQLLKNPNPDDYPHGPHVLCFLRSSSRTTQSRLFCSKKSRLLHAGGAVDADDFAVDPLAVLAGQESGDAGDVDGHTHTVHGGPGGGVLVDLFVGQVLAVGDVLLADGVVHVGLDAAGGDGVDGDLLVAKVCEESAGEGGAVRGGGTRVTHR